MNQEIEVLTLREVAREVGLPYSTLCRLAANGFLRTQDHGHMKIVVDYDLEQFKQDRLAGKHPKMGRPKKS